jgi:hypothetical protein
MSELQTLMALVVLIFVLAVIVQAMQEVLKSLLDTKAETMKETIVKFMGDHLTLKQVQDALATRGLNIAALENFNKDDFRHLLDGIELAAPQVQDVVANANATIDQVKNNIAGAYEGARASFQKAYARKNKLFAVIISFVVVLGLNASLIRIYEILGANQTMSQAIAGTASTITNTGAAGQSGSGTAQSNDLEQVYAKNRQAITADLQKYPILVRTGKYSEDWDLGPLKEIAGLIVMALLVSLGAPFWNDVLKGMTGVNNVLNTGSKQSS